MLNDKVVIMYHFSERACIDVTSLLIMRAADAASWRACRLGTSCAVACFV